MMLFVAVHGVKIPALTTWFLHARARRAPPRSSRLRRLLAAGADSFLLNPVGAMVRSAAAVERQPSYGVAVGDTAIRPHGDGSAPCFLTDISGWSIP